MGLDTWHEDPSLIRRDSQLIDRLVEMIPPRFYCPTQPEATPARFLKGASAKAEAKKAAKERSKKAKRLKLDPSAALTTVELQEAEEAQRKQQQGDEEGSNAVSKKSKKRKAGRGGDEGGAPGQSAQPPGAAGTGGIPLASARAGSHEELRRRLEQRLQELRAKRNAGAAEDAKQWRDRRHAEAKTKKQLGVLQKKTKTTTGKEEGGHVPAPQAGGQQQQKQQRQQQQQSVGKRKAQDADLDLEFGKVRMSTGPVVGRAENGQLGKKRKGKKETTGSLLKKAVALQQKLQQAEQGGDQQAQTLKDQHAWSAAVSRAGGQKVLDDPGLLRQSLKRQQKQKQKNAQKWEERKRGVAMEAKERNQKRQRNIQQRKDKKLAGKIAKREKKLMRPGFEGRAGATPINSKREGATKTNTE